MKVFLVDPFAQKTSVNEVEKLNVVEIISKNEYQPKEILTLPIQNKKYLLHFDKEGFNIPEDKQAYFILNGHIISGKAIITLNEDYLKNPEHKDNAFSFEDVLELHSIQFVPYSTIKHHIHNFRLKNEYPL